MVNEVQFVTNIQSTDTNINSIGVGEIADARIFENGAPTVIPPTVPVTEIIGTPVVNMPGCVKVHKENVKQRSRNKMLVDDDPKGNTVLCDAGAPYYDPAEYDYRGLTWQDLYLQNQTKHLKVLILETHLHLRYQMLHHHLIHTR